VPQWIVITSLVCASVAACGDDEEVGPGRNGGRGGTAGRGGNAGTAGNGGTAGAAGTAGTGGSAGDGGATTLCDKYGGKAGVQSAVAIAVDRVAGDCRINTFFTTLEPAQLTHVVQCLTIQSQELFGCADVTYLGSRDALNVPCRSMAEAHRDLNISAADFDAFIEDVVAGLTAAGVSADDINAVAPTLLDMKPTITRADAGAGLTQPAECSDAGADARTD
jgi:hypothetical protein